MTTEPIEVTVRGVKARIAKSKRRGGGFVIWNDDSWLLGESGKWRSEDNQEDAIVLHSPADAQAFVDRLNAEWEREKRQTLRDRADAEDQCESVLACGGLVGSTATISHGPFSVMDGAPWNVLDSRGVRIALCGGDSPVDWERYGPPIAAAVAAALNAAAPPASHAPQGETCRECNGLGWIGDNEAGAPECDCPDCGGSGKQPPAAPDAGVREFIAAAQKLSGYVAADLSANREHVGTVWYKDMLDAVRSVTKHSPDLTRQLAAEREGREKAEAELVAIDMELNGPKLGGNAVKALESVKQARAELSGLQDELAQLAADKECPNCVHLRLCSKLSFDYSVKYRDQCKELRGKLTAAERELATVRQQLAEAEQQAEQMTARIKEVEAKLAASSRGGIVQECHGYDAMIKRGKPSDNDNNLRPW